MSFTVGRVHGVNFDAARVPTVETVHLQVARLEAGVGGWVGLVRGLTLSLLLLLLLLLQLQLVVVGALLLLVIGRVLRVQNLLQLIKKSITARAASAKLN